MRVIDLLGAQPQMSDEDAMAALVQGGVGAADAFLLIRLVPCGLAFALLKRMGLTKFPSTYAVVNAAGEWVQLPLATEHYFSAALDVGYDVTTRGFTKRVSKEVFQTVAMRSAEMDVVNKYFESGGTREGLARSALSPPTFIGLTAEQIDAGRQLRPER